MELYRKTLPPDHTLLAGGDWHVGCLHFHKKAALAMVERVRTEANTYLVLVGDMIEARDISHPYFESDTSTQPSPIKQAEEVVEILRPIKDKILVINEGNHEHSLVKYGDIVRDLICKPLGIPYGTYVCKVAIQCGKKQAYKIYMAHGWGSINSSADDPIRREAMMRLSLKRKLKDKFADCDLMMMGHTHKLIVAPPTATLYLTDDGKKIHHHYTGAMHGDYIPPDNRWYVNTGSLMKLHMPGVSGYAERSGYDPVDLGYAEVIVKGGKIQTIEKRVIN